MNVAIQLARLSGFSPIITTASLRNEGLCKELGATHVIDRTSSNIKSEIETALNSVPLMIVYDAVGLTDGLNIGWDVLAPGGILAHHPHRPFDVAKYPNKFTYSIFGDFNAPHLTELGLSFTKKWTEMLEDGSIKVMTLHYRQCANSNALSSRMRLKCYLVG